MKFKSAVIINDCCDRNAAARQTNRFHHLFGFQPTFVGASCDLEASGHVVDAFDSSEGDECLILGNVAPRNGNSKHQNGSPFGFVKIGSSLIVSTADGLMFSFLRKILHCELRIEVIEDVLSALKSLSFSTEEVERRARSQFRSFDVLIPLAYGLCQGVTFPTRKTSVIPHLPSDTVWYVDSFLDKSNPHKRRSFNVKTTRLSLESTFKHGEPACRVLDDTIIPYYPRLCDVPDQKAAVVEGSSGFGTKRCLEIVINGGSAAETFKLGIGSKIHFLDSAS